MRHVKTEHHALKASRALVIGVGGLGSPAAIALAEAGVGTIGLIDPDRVDVSNLHRQPLYTDGDVGAPKVRAAAARLQAVRPGVQVITWPVRFGPDCAALLDGFDVLLDGTDSAVAKFDINDAAVARRLPLVHAGAIGTRAQLLTVLPGQTACLRCLFEESARPRRGAVLRGGRSARALRRARRQPAGARRRSACSPAPERCSPAACSRSTCGTAPGAACRWRRAPRVSPAASCIGKFSRKGA